MAVIDDICGRCATCVENPQRAKGESSTSVRNAVALMHAYCVASDKLDACDVFMMRVVPRILDIRNIEMNRQIIYAPCM